MAHLKPKRLLLIGLIVIIFCVLAAMTPLGARTAMMIRFQVAELSADDSNSCERKSSQESGCTSEAPSYYLGERCFGVDVFYDYQFGPVRYLLVFKDSDYRTWRTYIDSVYHSGGTGTGMVID